MHPEDIEGLESATEGERKTYRFLWDVYSGDKIRNIFRFVKEGWSGQRRPGKNILKLSLWVGGQNNFSDSSGLGDMNL